LHEDLHGSGAVFVRTRRRNLTGDDEKSREGNRSREQPHIKERNMKATSRTIDGVEVIKLDGKITIGSGDEQLREVMTNALDLGKTKLLLDLSAATTMD